MKPSIKKMIGKAYMWRAEKHVIRDIAHQSDDLYNVTTPKQEFIASEHQLLKEFVNTPGDEQTQLVIINQAKNEMESMRSLSDILMDNIKKVQKDSKYIDQAKSINESAKNIIELKKTQLEVVRLLKG